jgi:apolipoprotein D and lipocalin family protein
LARFRDLSTLAALVGLICGCGADPPLDVARNVDLSRMQGKWYEIAKLPRITQTDCYATMGFYTQLSDGSLTIVNQCNVGGLDGPLDTVTMTATAPDPSTAAKLALQVGGFAGDYWILEVGSNYEYAVVGHPTRSYLWILSRTTTLDSATLQGVLGHAQGNQFDTSKLEYTPQTSSGDRVASDQPLGQVPPAVKTGCSASPASGDGPQPWAPLALVAVCAAARRLRGRTRPTTG